MHTLSVRVTDCIISQFGKKGWGLKLRNVLLCAQFVVTTLDPLLNNEGPLISTLIFPQVSFFFVLFFLIRNLLKVFARILTIPESYLDLQDPIKPALVIPKFRFIYFSKVHFSHLNLLKFWSFPFYHYSCMQHSVFSCFPQNLNNSLITWRAEVIVNCSGLYFRASNEFCRILRPPLWHAWIVCLVRYWWLHALAIPWDCSH